MNTCGNCSTENVSDAGFCRNCGRELKVGKAGWMPWTAFVLASIVLLVSIYAAAFDPWFFLRVFDHDSRGIPTLVLLLAAVLVVILGLRGELRWGTRTGQLGLLAMFLVLLAAQLLVVGTFGRLMLEGGY